MIERDDHDAVRAVELSVIASVNATRASIPTQDGYKKRRIWPASPRRARPNTKSTRLIAGICVATLAT
jgi:hypothetical protein